MIKLILWALVLGGFFLGCLAWLFPVEVVQSWVLERTTGDDYKKFEAIGRAEAGCWLVRFVGPLIGIVSICLLRNSLKRDQFLTSAYCGWVRVTQVELVHGVPKSWRAAVLRGFCVAWAMLALGHYGYALRESMTNWPYYRFKSGREVLPNISDSNRAVIRYLLQMTDSNSRIFIASDQKLYFLSYYLLPRRLYYQSHPDSEFVIPQPHLQRRMEAYRLGEIDSKIIGRIAPDYLLEYFEQPDFVDRTRLQEDTAWMSFYRQLRQDSQAEPNYLVCLRRVEKGRH